MGLDVFSPVATAQVNVLVLPANNVKSDRFESFFSRLKEVYEVRLGDLSPKAGSESFSPLAFPPGRLLFRFSTSERPTPALDSFPFELNREPQVVLALADGETLLQDGNAQREVSTPKGMVAPTVFESLIQCLEDRQAPEVKDVMFIPKPAESQLENTKRVLCDIGVLFLNGMHDVASAIQELATIESPSVATSPKIRDGAQDLASKARQRMSMPFSHSPNAASGGSTNSPPQNGSTPPASNINSKLPSRDQSRDRYSIMESTATSPPSPRLAVRKGRALVVMGAMFLQAGRWPDALKTLSEGVAMSQANVDYLWHARGLEYILVCILLSVWAKLPFEIPSVCLPSAEQRTRTGPAFHTLETTSGESVPSARGSDQLSASMQILKSLFSDVVRSILTMYARAIAFTAEKIPYLLLCEVKIRLVGLLLVVSSDNGTLDQLRLDQILVESRLSKNGRIIGMSSNFGMRKEELLSLLLEAIPSSSENLPTIDFLEILLGISALLSLLGLGRKQAFFLKEVLSGMIPGLVEARKIGAAEMGIHPSAGLPMSQGLSTGGSAQLKHSIKPLLKLVGEMYDVPYDREISPAESNTRAQRVGMNLRVWAHVRNCGDPILKMEILRHCISICEALPDFEGVLSFTVQLLQTGRNVITLPPTYLSGPPSLSQEEQTHLLNSIKRTVGAAARLGQKNIFAEYWDDFLIRGVEALEPPEHSRFTVRSSQEFATVVTPSTTTKRDPFIYSSFAKANTKSDKNLMLTAGEMSYFAVVLQNPFEFDVEIDRVSLIGEGCEFEASDHSIVLGRYCSQKFIMSGKPRSRGVLKITGCWARVRYCHERAFQIFSKPWSPGANIKLQPQRLTKGGPDLRDSEQLSESTSASFKEPDPDVLSLIVLDSQPMLSAIGSTLPQPAIMLLEGEIKTFQITLHNASTTASADFLLFTLQDSATTQLQDALASKELSPIELHELQLQLAATPSLKWVPEDNKNSDPTIAAGASSNFTFTVFGKPGLVNGVIQVDYAHVGVPRSEMKEKFYTRQLRYPLSLTVNGAIEIPRCNIMPFSPDFAWTNQQRLDKGLSSTNNSENASPQNRSTSTTATTHLRDGDQLMPLLSRLGLGSHGSDHCLLLLDLRNVWPNPLSISIQVRESSTKSKSPTDPWRRAYTVHELLQPTHISRIVLLLPRVSIREPHAPIPLLSNQRQFVVSASKLSAESEAANRETFWYREELLQYIRGTWRDELTGRDGEINMRKGIRLSARMIDAMKIDEIEVDFSIQALEQSSLSQTKSEEKTNVKQTGRAHFVLQANIFATLTAKIHNHSSDRLHLLLRLQPALRNQPHNIALELSKRFAWTGMLQRALHPPLEAGETREVELGIIALCAGEFEVGVMIEEVRPFPKQPSEIGSLPVAPNKRRVWHVREPCLIDAVDNEDP